VPARDASGRIGVVRLPESIDTPLRTVVCILILPAALGLASLLGIVLALLGAPARRVHIAYVGFARLCILIGATRLEVHGANQIEPNQAYLVVSNHESNWDLPVVVAALPELILRFIAKKQVMRIPIFGQALRITGNVRVVRTETTGDIQRIRKGMSERADEVSILFFAEGTRSRDGALLPFKKGASATAIGFGLPILPVAIAGTRPIWPKGKLRVRRSVAVVEVGAPISVEGLTLEDRTALRDRARAAVAELRKNARSRLRAQGLDPEGID
jgi:1-acyl-sn-glycerol-3-phosphate acyltransferase